MAVALVALALAAMLVPAAGANDYVHGIMIKVDSDDYYFAGAPDGPNGATDIPGHYWMQTAPNRLLGEHYNEGPFGADDFWSSDAGNDALLFTVEAVIDTWNPAKAGKYAAKGFVHYHELVRVSDGELHPRKVVWLRHTPQAEFTLDGGPHPELSHAIDFSNPLIVYDGYDYQFIPNYFIPYAP
jgi:hypothetical protein